MKKLVYFSTGILISYVILELMSLLAMLVLRELEPNYFQPSIEKLFDGIDKAYVMKFKDEAYHPILGWDNKPDRRREKLNCLGNPWTATYTPDGSRANSLPYETAVIATYGDSFTHSSEVNNDETWQYFLSKQIGMGVKNFGVGGYGTLQALLKLKGHIQDGLVPRIFVLGIFDTNIQRVINQYRPFLAPDTHNPFGFKPAVRCPDGQCRVIENPLKDFTADVDALKQLAYELEGQDYFAQHRVRVEYPYFLKFLKIASDAIKSEYDIKSYWVEPEAIAAMDFIIADFYRTVREAGSIPVVLFIPDMRKLKHRAAPPYTAFKEKIREQYSELVVVDVMESEVDIPRFNQKPYSGCHASVYGNQVIARAVAEKVMPLLHTIIPQGSK